MKLPNANLAIVEEAKIVNYLLNPAHPDNGGKAGFFIQFGFTSGAQKDLAQALLHHAADQIIAKTEDSPYGLRYVVEGVLNTPGGRTPSVRSVWFVESGEEVPRFVTAYPLRRRKP